MRIRLAFIGAPQMEEKNRKYQNEKAPHRAGLEPISNCGEQF